MAKTINLSKVNVLLAGAEAQMKNMATSDKDAIIVMPELEMLIPPLSDEELNLLTLSLTQEGCRENLIVWAKEDGELVLIDGHNRLRVCKDRGIDFQILKRTFEDLDAVKDWMILNQLGKRNITEESKSYLRGLQYAQARQKRGGKGVNQYALPPAILAQKEAAMRYEAQYEYNRQFGRESEPRKPEEMRVPKDIMDEALNAIKVIDTATRIANVHGVSDRTIRNDLKFAEAIEKLVAVDGIGIKHSILNKQVKGNRNDIIDLAQLTTPVIKNVIAIWKGGADVPLKSVINKIKGLSKLTNADIKAQNKAGVGNHLDDYIGAGKNVLISADKRPNPPVIDEMPNPKHFLSYSGKNGLNQYQADRREWIISNFQSIIISLNKCIVAGHDNDFHFEVLLSEIASIREAIQAPF